MPHSSRKRPAAWNPPESLTDYIVFLTVCTKHRKAALADTKVHAELVRIWMDQPSWLVGRYVLMPDHVHLFCSPSISTTVPLPGWVRYWKSHLARSGVCGTQVWQSGFWDTRIRSGESFEAKWSYVRDNPVRAGLCRNADEWPFQGEIYPLKRREAD